MDRKTCELEAMRCRLEARKFRGRPEFDLLLRIATAFDQLATGAVRSRYEPRA